MSNNTISRTPVFESRARKPLSNGRVIGVDNSMWLYRTVPMGNVRDAKTAAEALNVSGPLAMALSELSGLVTTRGVNRQLAKKKYREFHLLMTNFPRWYKAPESNPIRSDLNRWFRDMAVSDRRLLIGVRLIPTTGDGTLHGFLDSVEQTLFHGGVLPSDYDKDFEQVSAAFDRAGLGLPTAEDFAAADGWWNLGDPRPVAELRHTDHMHFFSTTSAWKEAQSQGLEDCQPWIDLPDHRAITFASLAEFDLGYTPVDDEKTWWASSFLDLGARVISARGFIEPPVITKQELKSQKRRMRSDLEEGYAKGKDQARREEREAEIHSIEAQYDIGKNQMPPTIVDLSVLVGLEGMYDDDDAIRVNGASLFIMSNRQLQAWHETMICSNVRGNPSLHDVPATTLAYAGFTNLTRVGDKDGAFLGLTRDKQPVYLSAVAASSGDSAPLCLVGAATGAGKLYSLDTPIPTPDGWTTMGDLTVGDEIYSRDGGVTRVLSLSEINENPDLYRVSLSDGQTLKADRDHQWVVSDFSARNFPRKPSHRDAIARQRARLAFASQLRAAAGTVPHDLVETYDGLTARVISDSRSPWASKESIYQVLRFMEVPTVDVPYTAFFPARRITKTDPARLYPTVATLTSAIEVWRSDTGRWAAQSAARADAATALLERDFDDAISTRVLGRAMAAAGAPGLAKNLGDTLGHMAREAGIRPVDGFTEVVMDSPEHTVPLTMHGVNTRMALTALAGRLEFLASEELTLDPSERIVTTGEMLAEGLLASAGQANFAIRVTSAIHGPDVDLPVAPYTLGAWLGDGSTGSGGLTGIDPEVWERVEADGYEVAHRADPKDHYIKGLVGGLREVGVLADKRIPMAYLRASFAQRLAVLQGLMDTDGTISTTGGCELSLSKADLVTDALELIRSLGIKAFATSGPTSYVHDGQRVHGKDRTRIHFTTDLPVFHMARKAVRVPAELRETQKWLYVKGIEQIPAEPGRCIQVDSADATYLAGGFVPSHNTVLAQWIAKQHALMGAPTVFIDPKENSDLRAAFLDVPGFTVRSFDDFISSDGGLDPLTLYKTPEEGIQLAADMLFNVNPWGDERRGAYEAEIINAIRYGVNRGAKVTGQALSIAYQNGQVRREVIEDVFRVAQSAPMFRATFGMTPPAEGAQSLATSNSITLFMRGRAPMSLPSASTQAMSSAMRQTVNLLRMLVRGSMIALTGRGGVLHMDEAWVLERAVPDELVEIGRLARSQNVLPILYTQTPTGPLKLKLQGYFSRGLIGHISDPKEAHAALELFSVDRDEVFSRVTARETLAGDQGVNYNSLKALYRENPQTGTRQFVRGSEFLYGDLKERFAATTIMLPAEFLELASTNPDDVNRRMRELQQAH